MGCYEGAAMIKTFRGLMADGAQETITLHTNDGSIGYRIVKLQVMQNVPGTITQESVVKIYKIAQTSVDGTVDFSDNTLLGTGILIASDNANYQFNNDVIFDQEIFNQDIYITHADISTGEACNYYLELEQVKLNLGENTVATLKDIRNVTAPV